MWKMMFGFDETFQLKQQQRADPVDETTVIVNNT